MNDFLRTTTTILVLGIILALFTWKPIDVAWMVYDKYEDIELAIYGLLLSLIAYISIVVILGTIAYGIEKFIGYINKKVNNEITK